MRTRLSESRTETSIGTITRSSSTPSRCEVSNRRCAVPTAARSHPKRPRSRPGNLSKKRSAIFGEMRRSTTKTIATLLFLRESWRQGFLCHIILVLALTPNQEYFNRRVLEAKKLVPDSIQADGDPEMPRIKLRMGAKDSEPPAQKITLKMSGQTSETPSKGRPSSGVAVDNDSLKRQQELVRTGSASQDADAQRLSPRTRSLRRHISSPRSSVATTPSASEQAHGVLTNGRDVAGVIKDETPMVSSQHLQRRSSHGLQGGPLEPTPHGPPSYDGMALVRFFTAVVRFVLTSVLS